MDSREVARELRAYGEELALLGAAQVGSAFSGDESADILIKSSPNAFLLGVLFTQGISAERAWAGPYLLRERLGHLDVRRLASDVDSVAVAVSQAPALHRFIHTLPRWIVSAASRLCEEYAGSAAQVWRPGSHVTDVTERLLAFDGIGEKKAAMAVSILTRHFDVSLEGAECGSVAFDVHVRRVFLRTGLSARDNSHAIQKAARRICPEEPGLLDLPAWLIGREMCRPHSPRCEICRLGRVCPRLMEVVVDGVGVRR